MTPHSNQPPAKKTSRMAKGIMLVLALGVGVFLSVQAAVYSANSRPERAVWGQNEQNIVAANNQFGLDLFMNLGNNSPNVFFSPFSVSAALTMTLLGARGDTATQLMNALHFDNSISPDVLHGGFQTIINELFSKEQNNYLIRLANKIYLQHKFNVLSSFKDGTNQFYQAEAENLDFVSDAEAARNVVNNWVKDVTEDKIKELLQPGVLSDVTRFIIVNAIYFKGNWQSKFDQKMTKKQNFYINDKEKAEVDMMYQNNNFLNGFDENLDAQILQLPYAGGELSMVIVLPNERSGLLGVQNKLKGDLTRLTQNLQNTSMEVYLPKFAMTENCDLLESLKSLGITSLFSDKESDLSGISGDRELYVSHVVHKAYIDVSEEGTEAAAATAVVGVARMAAKRSSFRADHPFFFFIRHMKTGSVVFVGRYSVPAGYTTKANREDL